MIDSIYCSGESKDDIAIALKSVHLLIWAKIKHINIKDKGFGYRSIQRSKRPDLYFLLSRLSNPSPFPASDPYNYSRISQAVEM